MTVSATARRAGPYSCNGATVAFSFSFKVFADADVQVIKTDSSGVQTVLTLTTNYTVSRNADQENNPGGTITTVATYAAGNTITIIGAVAYTQTADITNASGFFPEVVENALDRVTILAQQLKELFARVISFPASDSAPSGELVTAANRASKWLAFDSSGNPIASVSAPGTAIISAFMETVLDDASAAAARTTLGAFDDSLASTFARTYLDDTTQAATRTTLGVGTGDTPSFTRVNETSGTAVTADYGGAANATGDGTTYQVNFAEVRDKNNNFVNGTPSTFTAPVAGYYKHDVRIVLTNLGANHNNLALSLVMTGLTLIDTEAVNAAANIKTQTTLRISETVYMAAGDTAYVTAFAAGGTKTVGVSGAAGYSRWSIALVALP